jgi:hypothetical protein
MVSTFFLVTGALLLGDALHGSVVTAQYPVTSPAAVVRGVGGIVAIALGYRLKTPASEYAAMPSDEPVQQPNEENEENREFDAEMSPLSEEQFEDLDADDEK